MTFSPVLHYALAKNRPEWRSFVHALRNTWHKQDGDDVMMIILCKPARARTKLSISIFGLKLVF